MMETWLWKRLQEKDQKSSTIWIYNFDEIFSMKKISEHNYDEMHREDDNNLKYFKRNK